MTWAAYGFGVVDEQAAEPLTLAPAEPPEMPLGVPMTPAPGFDLSRYEHNTRLTIPTDRAVYFSKMERVNPSIAMLVGGIRTQIASATVELTEGEHAEELAMVLGLSSEGGRGLPSMTAAETVVEMHRAITDGCYIGDPVWERDAPSGLWYPDRVEFRDLRTIVGALYSAESGKLVGFVQRVQHGMTFDFRVLPIFHVVYCVDRPDAGPMGEGLKRACVRPHEELVLIGQRLKSLTYKAGVRACQIVYADVPDWAAQQVRNLHASIHQQKDGWATKMTADAKKAAALNGSGRSVFAPTAGTKLEPIGDMYDPSGLLLARQSCHTEILQRGGVGYLNLGARGTGGTYNLGEVQAEHAESAARGYMKTICRAYNRSIIARAYDYNWPDVPESKRAQLTFKGLDSARMLRQLEMQRRAYEMLALPGLTPDDITQIRETAGLPPMDEASMRLASTRAQVSAATGGQLASAARAERRRIEAEQAEEDANV